MKKNRNFKDSVFTMLFSDPALLRELYGAIGGVPLPPDIPVFINTLENVLFMDFNNDISFEIGGEIGRFDRTSKYHKPQYDTTTSTVLQQSYGKNGQR